MTNIVKFPKKPVPTHPETTKPSSVVPGVPRKPNWWSRAWSGLLKVIWMLTVIIWPLLRWVISVASVCLFIRMIYYWDTPGIHAGVDFILSFFILTVLTYYVSHYKPKGF